MFRLPSLVPDRWHPSVFRDEREQMVQDQLIRRGITDARVLEAFRTVPRHRFVPPELEPYAYDDCALPIAHDQTISQPYVVALTLQALALDGRERVLEVGTGSGYAAALLSRLAREVFTIDRLQPLARAAAKRLLPYRVSVGLGDGTLGWPAEGPFDAIAVAASGPCVPPALLEQLAPTGRIVMPVREAQGESLLHVAPGSNGALHYERLQAVRFVPLIGEQGLPAPS